MSRLRFKNEAGAPATPPADYLEFYAVGDALFWKDDSGTEHSIASGIGDLLADGSVPLTANWDVGAFDITAEQFHSDIAIGDPPFTVVSTTVVTNLNADQVDGMDASDFATAAQGALADSALQSADIDTLAELNAIVADATLVDESALEKYVGQNLQTGTAYELVLTDAGKIVEMNNGSANTLTIPANASVAFPVDTRIDVIQYGAGQTTIAITSDTLRGDPKIAAQYEMVSLWKRAATEWVVIGGTT